MSHTDPSIHQQGKDLKHEGGKDKAVGTAKKVVGKITGDEDMEVEGAIQKKVGDAEHATGKFVENVTK